MISYLAKKSYLLAQYLLLILLSACNIYPPKKWSLEEVGQKMLRHDVAELRVEDLLESTSDSTWVLLDARSREEFEVSHLPGAKWIGFRDLQVDALENLPKDQPLLIYCSIGYRSEKITRRIQNMGFERVANLVGGIFDWKNKGHEVVNMQSKPTQEVHTYNAHWGNWLEVGEKVW